MNGFSNNNINKYESEKTMAWNPKLLISYWKEETKTNRFTVKTDQLIWLIYFEYVTNDKKSKWIGDSHVITTNMMHNGFIKYAVYVIRLYGNKHLALRIRFMIPPRPQAHATRNHAMPRDHAVFPRPVYNTAVYGFNSFLVGPKIIEINSSGPMTQPITTYFCVRKQWNKKKEKWGEKIEKKKQ